MKKFLYIILSLILTIVVVVLIFLAGAVSKNVTVNKLISGTRYETIDEDRYNSLLLKSYIKLLNKNKDYVINDKIECIYIIEFGDNESFCYDGGDYAYYVMSKLDEFADSKTKVVQFFNEENNGYDKSVVESKIVKIPTYLKKMINKI